MPRAKIFISHSTKTSEARLYLDALKDALDEDSRFEVLLDEDCLQGGDDWRERIYGWMDQAHGAVLLLSGDALESSFVPIELSVLSFRHCREQKFPLIPVLVGEVQPEDTRNGVIGDIDLGKIQFVRGLEPSGAAREVVTALRSFFTKNEPRTAREIIESHVARYLRKAGLEEIDLAEVVDGLAEWPKEKTGSKERNTFSQFARVLLRVSFDTACTAICELVRRWPEAAYKLFKVLELVSPFWIEESEAAAIAELALQEESSKRLLAIDAAELWTVRSFICRACSRRMSTRWICEVEPPDDESEQGLSSLRRQFIDHLNRMHDNSQVVTRRRPDLMRRFLQHVLQGHEENNKPVFIVLNRDWRVNDELVERFRDEFSTPTVLVMGARDEVALQEGKYFDIPSPGREREERAFMTYLLAQQDLSMEGSG